MTETSVRIEDPAAPTMDVALKIWRYDAQTGEKELREYEIEHVEQGYPLGRIDLVLLQRAIARRRVVAPDLQRDVHVS